MRLDHADPRNMTLSPLNMHHGEPEPDVSDILGSIRQKGVLQPLLVLETYKDGAIVPGAFEIVAGRRRWKTALAVIAEGVEVDPLPIVILAPGDDAAAIEASLLENMARLPPGEVAKWETFVRLIRKGRTPEDLAITFSLSGAVVARILALGNLLPRIRKLYRKEAIDVPTIRQLTLASKAQQKAWLDMVDDPEQRAPTGHQLKAWLFGGEAIPVSRAIFPLDVYPGAIIGDLFGEDSYFTDAAIFWRCQNEAVAAKVEALKADGWLDVEVKEVGHYFQSHDYVRTPKDKGGKVIITVSARGDVELKEGWLTRREARKASAAQAKSGQAGQGHGGTEGEGEGTGNAKPEVTISQQTYIDLHRRAAVRAVLPDHPGVALRLLLAHAVAGSPYWRVETDPLGAGSPLAVQSIADSPAQAKFAEHRARVMRLLGRGEVGALVSHGFGGEAATVFAKLLALSDEDVLAVAAVVMAETLAAGSVEVEAAGTYLAVDIAQFWTPDEAFFDGIKDREAVNAMLREVGGKKVADGNLTEKVRTQKAILRDYLDGTGGRPKVEAWTPRWMSFPASAYTKRPFPPAQKAKTVAPLLRRLKPTAKTTEEVRPAA